MRTRMRLPRRGGALTAAGALLITGGLAALGPSVVNASSHREAPLIAGEPQYDNTDVYAFVSPDRPNTVTMIANWIPLEEPAGGPNFYAYATDARYNIKVDRDGDALADITYQWTFRDHYRTRGTFLYNTGVVTDLDDPDLNFYQTYKLKRITPQGTLPLVRNGVVAPSFVGDASMPDYGRLRNQAIVRMGGHGATFAGQIEDPFFLDLRVFDLLYGGDLSEVGDDTLAGFNTHTLALQVRKDQLAAGHRPGRNPVIGIWSTTDERGADGRYRQISRLGNPLVNEVVIPLKDKNRFNASKPVNDAQFLSYVTHPELPTLIEAIYGIPAPATPRADLVQVFLTGVPGLNQPRNVVPSEQLRLNMSIPPSEHPDRLGVIGGDAAGYPNGRRLADDVVDIALQVVEGELVGSPNDLGDAVDENDAAFGRHFPYVALPVSGSAVDPHTSTADLDTSSATTPGDGASTPSGALVGSMTAMVLGLLLFVGGVGAMTRRRPRRTAA